VFLPKTNYFLTTDPNDRLIHTYSDGGGLTVGKIGLLPDGSGELFRTGLKATPPRRIAVLDIETEGLEIDHKILYIGLLLHTPERTETVIIKGNERLILKRFLSVLERFAPDVIVGHNAYKFDCPHINGRLVRNGFTSLFVGETTNVRIGSERKEIVVYRYGRTPVHDTYILAQRLDAIGIRCENFNLKSLAVEWLGMEDWGDYMTASDKEAYLKKDLEATYRLYRFTVAHWDGIVNIVPVPYDPLMGNGTLVNTLFCYLMLPFAPPPKEPIKEEYEGGYVEIRRYGYAKPVGHLDVVSLYPHIMLNIQPSWDVFGLFPRVVRMLLDMRLEEKEKAKRGDKNAQKNQLALKILINSFYGFLGATFTYSDPKSAKEITRRGRELVKRLCELLSLYGFEVIEVDTDGVYFTAEDLKEKDERIEEITLDFPMPLEYNFYDDGLFVKKKNYVLRKNGKQIIKGGLITRKDNLLYKELVQLVISHLMDGSPTYEDLLRKCVEYSRWELKTYPKRWYEEIKPPSLAPEKERLNNMRKLFAVLRRFETVLPTEGLGTETAKRLLLEEKQMLLFGEVDGLWQ